MDTSRPPPPRGRFLVHPSKRNLEPPPRGRFLIVRGTIQHPPKPLPLDPDPPSLPDRPIRLQPIDEKPPPFDDQNVADQPPPSPPDPVLLQPIDEKPTPSIDVQDTVVDPVPPPQPVDEKTSTPPDDDQITNDLLPKYDAFISFRGTDVRNFFLSHLFAYMNNEKHILTYEKKRRKRLGFW
ncbi:unnamed protein product [Linum trigynum]|uniref:TIR domain-containing protein n=1 Tax=Linum trigynum TaxID=586398 RepID=A0AAV2D2M5_9ROSI